MKKLFLTIFLFGLTFLTGCPTVAPDNATVIGTHEVAKPIPVPTKEEIHQVATDMAAITDSSRNSATEVKQKSTEIKTTVNAGAAGTITPKQVSSEVSPRADAINTLSDAIVKDQDALRKKVQDAEADVVKMRTEIDRMTAETKSVRSAYEADLKNLDVKYKGELAARDGTIKDLGTKIDNMKEENLKLKATVKEILTGSFRVVIYFGIAFIIAGLAMLYFLADKRKGAGAVVIGMIAVALGGMLPSMVDAASKAGVWAVWGIFGVGAAYAVYLLIMYARSQKTNEQLFKTNVILGKKDASLTDEETKKQIALVQDSTTKEFVAAQYKIMDLR